MTSLQRSVGLLGAIVLGLMAALLPAAPVADAAVTPWTWKRVVVPVNVAPNGNHDVRAVCPAGFIAVTGGLLLPNLSQVYRQSEYRQDDASGSGWRVVFQNPSGSSGTASVVAECVEAVDLPPLSYNLLEVTVDSSGRAEGEVPCANAGEVVLTGGVDWNNILDRRIFTSGPPASASSWYAYGRNEVVGSKFGIEVYCVNQAYVPGYETVAFTRTGSGWFQDTVTCPAGKRVLNGGTSTSAYASYPTLNKWTATYLFVSTATQIVRANCVDAGTPTVSITSASPGVNGAVTNLDYASFTITGTDPAGFPNGFRCSLDGGVASSCPGGAGYGSLSSGSHQFVTWNTTSDGRTSGVDTYQWTVDREAPTVTTPTLPKATLTASALAKWSGSDQYSGIDHYEAAYTLNRADGTSTGWIHPEAWKNLGLSVQTPDALQGETVCVAVKAVDEVLNASPWSAPSCTTRPLDDRALTASSGWSRATGSAYWLNTVTRTTASGETLKRSAVNLNRVGILATECPRCGAVVVKVGDTKVGRINLDAATLANRKVRLLPAFSGTTGTVTIKSVTTGKTISIDGLVPIQSVSTPPT